MTIRKIIFPVIALLLLQQLVSCSKSGSGGSGNTPTPSGDSVSTIAGNGMQGLVNGAVPDAEFYYPDGITVDAQGNVYVADGQNNCIREITTAGAVSTLAGNGISGWEDGPGTTAEFSDPYGIFIDPQGNIYVGDWNNNRVRVVTAQGVTSTLAGSGKSGLVNGTGTAAEFSLPWAVAVDAQGNAYVADRGNSCIRKITAQGVVTTFAGNGTKGFVDGTAATAEFNNPTGVALDGSGNVYVADWLNNRIRKITSAGVVSTLAGSGNEAFADGTGINASFNQPVGITIDPQGNVYVADEYNNRIREITPAGAVTTLAGNGTQGFADGAYANAEFSLPVGVSLDTQGNVYVADQYNNRIRKITLK